MGVRSKPSTLEAKVNDQLPSNNNLHNIVPRIINISKYNLTNFEKSLLLKGFKFCPTPKNSNLLDLEVEIKEFINRLCIFHQFHDLENNDNSLLSKKGEYIASTPKDSAFNGVIAQLKSLAENLDKLGSNKIRDNISFSERTALQNLQNNKEIVIKKADKGSSIIIMDRNYYISKINECLEDQTLYEKLITDNANTIKIRVKNLVNKYKTCFDDKGKEMKYVSNFDSKTSNFYGNPKIHKSIHLKEALKSCKEDYLKLENIPDLSFRMITAGPISPTSKLSELIDILLKPFLIVVPAYIRDSTDFLNKIYSRNSSYSNPRIITADIKAMYPNIDRKLGIRAIKYFLINYPSLLHPRFNKDFVIEAIELILQNSSFQFNGNFYNLKSGTVTGTALAPTFANLVMAFLEVDLYDKVRDSFDENIADYVTKNWFRFIDDGFIIWNDEFGDYKTFTYILNSLDPNIKFTHDSSKIGLSFLNVYVYFENGILNTDVFYKETDSHYYLPFDSCHPRHIKNSIPNNLARIICTIVSDPIKKEVRLDELKSWLFKCGYPCDITNSAILKVSNIPQEVLRQKVNNQENDVLAFVHTFNPKNPDVYEKIIGILDNLKKLPQFGNIFKNARFIKSQKQPQNLGQLLQKSDISQINKTSGCNKCKQNRCATCKFILEGREVEFSHANKTFILYRNFSCNSTNLIYKITCKGCNEYYIGQTANLKSRLNNHKFCVENEAYRVQNVHRHIGECAKNLVNKFSIIPFYICKNDTKINRLATETYFIRKFKPKLNST